MYCINVPAADLFMSKSGRLAGFRTSLELDFVEREATPKPAMKLGIHLHAVGLLLSGNISVLAGLGVDRCRSTIHKYMQEASSRSTDSKSLNHVALDETVIQFNDQDSDCTPLSILRLTNSSTSDSIRPEASSLSNGF